MDTAIQTIGHFRIQRTESHQATERGLDVPAGAAEAIVQIEVAKCSVEIVAPHQHDDTATEPYAFRVAGRTVDRGGRLNELVGLLLAFLGDVGGSGRRIRGGLLGLILGAQRAALGYRAAEAKQQRKSRDGNTTQNRILEPDQHSTHKVPDLLSATVAPTPCQMPPK